MLSKLKNKKIIIIILVGLILAAGLIAGIIALNGNNGYQVTFYSDTDVVLKVDNVEKNQSATPPNEPQITYGKVFQAWDKDFSHVKRNLEIHPVCEDVLGKSNAFNMPSAYGKKGDFVFIPLQLGGEVCVSGFDIIVEYDAEALELDSYFDKEEDVLINDEVPGILRINFICAKNTNADIDICKLKFAVRADSGKSEIKTTVNSIYAFEDSEDLTNDNLYSPESNVINSTVYVIS